MFYIDWVGTDDRLSGNKLQFPETSRLLVAFACILPFLIIVQGKKKKILDGQPEQCIINHNYSFQAQMLACC